MVAAVFLLCSSDLAAQQCTTSRLEPSLKSFSSAVALQNGLLGIDAVGQQVVRISQSQNSIEFGRQIGRVSSTAIEKVNEHQLRPMSFARAGNDIVQVYGEGDSLQVGWFDQRLQAIEVLSLGERAAKNRGQLQLLSPYDWIATQGHLVGFGVASSDGGQTYELGFADQPLPIPGSTKIPAAKLFHPFSNPSFYVLGIPFIVAAEGDNSVYYLEMGTTPSLYRYDLSLQLPPQEMKGLPGEDSFLNDPAADRRGHSARELTMSLLDEFAGPWGLYEQEGAIFLLTRRPTGSSTADWTLRELVIDNDGYIDQKIASREILIPSTAQQIVLVASRTPGEWLVFEQTGKGDERAIATMQTCSNLTPTSNTR